MTSHTSTKNSPFIIGIDLGTTNSTVAYINTMAGHKGQIEIFEIPQLMEEGVVRPHHILPSFIYLPGEYELTDKAAALPWNPDVPYIVGEHAKTLGARVSGHLVTSAKSWLCHSRVDRKAAILPWGSESVPKRVSPVEASAYYLKHMKDAWNYTMAQDNADHLFEKQQIIITIPASFDETARELTAEAARVAGIERFTMLEEPQAAFYCWVASHASDLDSVFNKERLVLVMDIGGGTTDFNLIRAWKETGKLQFERVAVGEHLMLGGDNMDLAIAREVEKKILGQKARLDYQRWLSLAQQGRFAKESLLDNTDSDKLTLSILGRGRSVIGGTLKTEITRQEVEETVLEGFFKFVDISEEVEKDRRTGFQELGLPFVQDTIVPRHLASFLNKHASTPALSQFKDTRTGKSFVKPDTILFNGGVFNSVSIRSRTLEILKQWFGNDAFSLEALENTRFEHAVSIGAAYYGMVLRGKGTRISGGSGRAYYVGVEGITASAGFLALLCIVPRGFEEGEELHLQSPEFQVMTNKPVSFPLYTSSYRVGDKPGDVVAAHKKDFIQMPPIKTVLHFGKKTGSAKIPVTLGIKLTEFGTLDVWCESRTTPHRWKLAFQVRGDTVDEEQALTDFHTLDAGLVDESCELIKTAFQSAKESQDADVNPENVVKKLTSLLSLDKNDFPISAIRKLCDVLIELKEYRTKSPQHEARWLNLAGFFLRPGFGSPLDDWRIKELWKLFHSGVSCLTSTQSKLEWWILWRRVAGGLSHGQQEQVFNKIAAWLVPSRKRKDTPRVHSAELNEMWMLAASLESLSIRIKTELGDAMLQLIKKGKGKAPSSGYWVMSRLGARIPFHGPVDRVVPAGTVEKWIEDIFQEPWQNPKEIAYTLTQLARKTEDRVRDIHEPLRNRITEKLAQFNWAGSLVYKINEYVPAALEDQKSIFGESLPVGLYVEGALEDEF